MTTRKLSWLWLTLGMLFAGNLNTTPLCAADAAPKADPAVQKICDQMLKAIQTKDRDAFIAHGTEAVKEGTTAEVMDVVHEMVGLRMADGFMLQYLTSLKQQGYDIYLWKLSFTEGDDIVVRMAMKDGKVAGFLLQ